MNRWTNSIPSSLRNMFSGQHALRAAIGNTGWLFGDKVLRMGGNFLVTVWMARYLGPDVFGVYSYALAFVMLFSTLSTLGLDSIVARDIVKETAAKDEILGTAFCLQLLGGFLSFGIAMGIVSIIRPGNTLIMGIIAILLASGLFQAFDTIDYWFQSQVRSKYVIMAKNPVFIACALLKIALIIFRAPLMAFVWVALVEAGAGAAALCLAFRSDGNRLRNWRFSIVRARRLLRDSWPLIFSGLMIMIYMRIDQIMLGEMLSDRDVGIYSAAIRLAEAWSFMPMVIWSSFLPIIVKARGDDEKTYYDMLRKLFGILTMLAYFVILVITFAADWIVSILYSSDYSGSGPVLSILVWTSVFSSLGVIRSLWIIAENYTRFSFITTAMGAVINILLNSILIKKYGVVGAALSTVIAQACTAYLANAFFEKSRAIFIIQTRALFLCDAFRIFRVVKYPVNIR